MRLLMIIIVFVSGIGVGMLLDRDPEPEPKPVTPVIQTAPEPAPVTTESLVRAGDFGQLVARTNGDLAAFTQAVADLPPAQQLEALEAFEAKAGSSLDVALARAKALIEARRHADAVAVLMEASLLPADAAEQARFERALEAAVDARARMLTAAGDTVLLDDLYEQITLRLPELGSYFLKLGTLRVQQGDYDGALAVLSQIQNHPEYGAAARSLLADAESGEIPAQTAGESLPLEREGDQFTVDAVLDDGHSIRLLIDTGASMTVLTMPAMNALGYRLDGPTGYFSTAAGVVEAPIVTVERLALGNAAIDGLSVGVLPVDLPGSIDGLLGMNFLRHFEFRIDQENQVLVLDPPG